MISVLYVDDDRSLLEIGKIFLERLGNFSVELLDSADTALETLSRKHFDAIVSDYEMPRTNGLEFLQIVRSQYGSIPFILFTGRGREEVVILALNNGADYYLQKGGEPQSQFAELAHKIRLAVHKRKADLALEESERRYRDVVETQTEFICRFTPDGTTVFVNEAYCKYFGKKREEILGTVFKPEIPVEDRGIVSRHFRSLTPEHPTGDLEHRIIMADGSIRWQWWRDHAFFDEDGIIVEFQSVGKDITEQKWAEEALTKQQLRFESLGRNIPGAIYQLEITTDHTFHFPYVSKSWIDLTGIPADEAMSDASTSFATIVEEDREELYRTIRYSAQTLTPWKHEFRTSFHNQIHWIYGSSIPEPPGPDGAVLWNGVLIDITDRKKAEYESRESENLYRAIFDNTGTATIIIEQDTTIIFANSGFARLSGYAIDELEMKKSWTEFVVPEDLERMKTYHTVRRDDPEDAPRVYEFRFINKDGKIRHCINNVSMIPGTTRSIASILDIHDRVLVENEYRSIFENIQDVFYRTDAKGNLILASPSGKDVLGYDSLSELIGKNVAASTYYCPEERDQLIGELQKTGSVTNYEVRLRRKDGTPITVLTSSHYYYDMNGDFQGIEGIFRDISERKQVESDLQRSETLYRAIFDNTGTATVIIEQDTTIVNANAEFARLSGLSIDELEGKRHWTDFVVPEDLKRMKKYHTSRRDNSENAPRVYEFRFVDVIGNIRYCIVNVTMIPGTLRSIASLLDITDRVLAEMDYRAIFDNIQDVFYRTDPEGIITLLSPSATTVLGYASLSDLVGKRITDTLYLNHEDRSQFLKELDKKGWVSNYEVTFKKQDGSSITILTSSHRYFDIKGNFQGIEGIFRDITERKNAEEALLASETKYRTIIENMQDLVYQADLQGNLTMISPAGARLAGYSSPEEMIGHNIADELYYEPLERKQFLDQLNACGAVKNYPLTLVDRNGSTLYVTANSHLFYDANGQPMGIEGILHDITEQRLTEEALLQANRKLNLLTDITRHDINNQLVSLLGFLSVLTEAIEDQSLKNYTRKAATAAERIDSIIQFTKQYEEIGVNLPNWQKIRDVVDGASYHVLHGSVPIYSTIPPDLEVYADPMFYKIINNLVENAIRYGEKITRIEFSCAEKGDNLIIICEDDGVGIPHDKKDLIFNRGFGQNTGLGLTLCREILHITGISISETGEEGKGARFEMVVPKKGWRI